MGFDDKTDEPCEQCGMCCKIFGDRIIPTITNLYCWINEGRKDILQYFSACKDEGTWVNCADLKPEELGDIAIIEMRDPVTHDGLCVCPFLRRFGRRKYFCGIHDTKPEMCIHYRPWIWGETYFTKCRTLVRMDNKKRWPE